MATPIGIAVAHAASRFGLRPTRLAATKDLHHFLGHQPRNGRREAGSTRNRTGATSTAAPVLKGFAIQVGTTTLSPYERLINKTPEGDAMRQDKKAIPEQRNASGPMQRSPNVARFYSFRLRETP